MNIDTLLVDLEIVGQVKENDKLAVCNVVGATKLFVNQSSVLNSVYRRYNGFNRLDSIVYLENLITRVETAALKIIEASFTDMCISLKISVEKAIQGINMLKMTYCDDSEMIARLTISNNKLTKVFENLRTFADTLDQVAEVYDDVTNIVNTGNNRNNRNNRNSGNNSD